MAKILIVYATQWGNTKKMAEIVKNGAETVPETAVILKNAEEAIIDDLLAADGIIFGSPVHMGSSDWRMKKFIDEMTSKIWMKDQIIGKVGGVFATGGGFGNSGGGCEITMLSMLNCMAELGLIMIPLPKNTPGYSTGGLQWGPYGRTMGLNMEQTGLNVEFAKAAFHHGRNIAKAAAHLKGASIFSDGKDSDAPK